MNTWYVYLIRCRNNSLYTGITTDVNRRFAEHQSNSTKGAKYLKGKGPLALAWQVAIGDRNTALKAEKKIKKLSKAKKEMLVRGKISIREIMESS